MKYGRVVGQTDGWMDRLNLTKGFLFFFFAYDGVWDISKARVVGARERVGCREKRGLLVLLDVSDVIMG